MIITNNFNSLTDEQLIDISGGTRNLFEDIGYAIGYAVGTAVKSVTTQPGINPSYLTRY